MSNTFSQISFMAIADTNGTVQMINVGKSDNGTPISFDLITQDLEMGDRTHLKAISDRMAVFTNFGTDTSLQVKGIGDDFIPIDTSLSNRVNVIDKINVEGYYFNFKWLGTVDSYSPVFEGLYIENIVDKGVVKP